MSERVELVMKSECEGSEGSRKVSACAAAGCVPCGKHVARSNRLIELMTTWVEEDARDMEATVVVLLGGLLSVLDVAPREARAGVLQHMLFLLCSQAARTFDLCANVRCDPVTIAAAPAVEVN